MSRVDVHFYLDSDTDKELIEYLNDKKGWKGAKDRSSFIRMKLYEVKEGTFVKKKDEEKKDKEKKDSPDMNSGFADSVLSMMQK